MKRKKHKAKLPLSLLIACLVTSTANALSPNIDLDKSGENTDLSLTEEIGYAGIIKLDPNHKLTIESNGNGIYSGWNKDAKFDIIADDIEIITHSGNGIYMSLENEGNGILTIGEEAETGRKINNLTINSHGQGIDNKNGSVTIYGSDESKISIHSDGYKGDYNEDQSAVNTGRLKDEYYPAKTGSTFIEGGTIELSSDGGSGTLTRTDKSSTTIIAHDSISISSNHLHPEDSNPGEGIYVYKDIENAGINNIAGTTTVEAENDISITSSQSGILAQSGTVDVTSTTGNNIIQAALENVNVAAAIDAEAPEGSEGTTDPQESRKYGTKHAIKAEGKSKVHVSALDGDNALYGVIYAKNADTAVTVDHNVVTSAGNVTGSGSNYIYSAAHGSTDEVGNREKVVAALYAQDKGQITITAGEGGINYIETYYPELEAAEAARAGTSETEDPGSERTIWAQRGGRIDITGTTIIQSSNAENFYENGYATNSRGIAITAGSEERTGDAPASNSSQVNLTYGGGASITINDKLHPNNYGGAIYGDIVSGFGGDINITKDTAAKHGLYIQGNILAANGGTLDVDLGQGGVWYGRADDYGDAGYGEEAAGKLYFYSPVFSNTITEGGTVNITMGAGSRWYLTGQSWVTSLDVSGGNGDVTIDMAQFNKGTHGLTISELKGTPGDDEIDATFIMDLDHNAHNTSDMLYIKNGTGEYDVVLNTMINGIEDINENNVLRFATVEGGASFHSVTMKDTGLYDLGFEIGHSAYDTSKTEENESYNGKSVSEDKPGNENVEGFFDLDSGSEAGAQTTMLLDETTDTDDAANAVQNWYITKVSGIDLSDGGKTVVNMSRVNYSNAVYMDRLNKRLGEARYINEEEDQGMWVRVRHDRIGKDDAFRLMNTMYELGYDKKQESDSGERRFGAAIDYMDGSSSYTSVSGSGDISRKGIWLYDTWLGHKGHYRDFVAKWGHLSNDFTLYRGGDKITGDYCNNVYSLSAEYGRKKDLGHDWYFEPQAQLQYARVTGADYTTSQGTRVDLDAIDSLIARAGFRLGRDLDERSTVYFKADLLHEFLGDQNIYAADGTGTMNVTYDNEGTWFDVGLGFSKALSETSYVYLDVETSLGNDFEDTYQINAGLQWSFS